MSRSKRGARLPGWVVSLVAAPGLAILIPLGAGATVYVIDSFADVVAADGTCSLREALQAAESNLTLNDCAAGAGDDTIILQAAGTYPFDLGEASLTGGALTMRGGTGLAAAHVIDLGFQNRFLHALAMDDISLTLEAITVRHGYSLDEFPSEGGALRIVGADLTMRAVAIEESFGSGGGGLYLIQSDLNESSLEDVAFRGNGAVGTPTQPEVRGGGAYVRLAGGAGLSLTSVAFEANGAQTAEPSANAFGGGAYIDSGEPSTAVVELRRLTVRDNQVQSAASGNGGGLALRGRDQSRMLLEDSTFADNRLLVVSFGSGGAGLTAAPSAAATMELRRLRVSGSSDASSVFAPGQVVAQPTGASSVLLDSLLVHDTTEFGIIFFAQDSAAIRAGQLTVTGNESAGVVVSSSSSVPPRIENSLLWGNSPPGSVSTDLWVFSGTADADRLANHNWIGDQGDPDPGFADPANGDFALLGTSGALEVGEASFASVGPFDASHAPRVVGAGLDLGAFERGGVFADDFESGGPWAWSAATP